MNNDRYGYKRISSIPPIDPDDAIQYTPLSSVVPLSTDMIPMATVSTGLSSLYHSDLERQNAQHALNILDQQAESNPDSNRVANLLHEIFSQINPQVTTGYRFKSLPDNEDVIGNSHDRVLEILRAARAGKFAEMAFGRINTPVTNQAASLMPPKQNSTASHRMTPKKLVVSLTQAHVPDVPSTPAPVSLTPNPYSQGSPKQLATPQSFQPSTPPLNGRKKSFHVQIPVSTPQPQFLTPDYRQFSTPQPQSQLNSTIVVLQPSPNIDRSEYTKYSKLDEKLKKSKPSVPSASKNLKRKRISDEDGDGNDDRLITAGVDQRAKADNLLSGFLDLADSIFTAEDNVQIDSSGGIAETSEMCRFWVPGSNPPCLCTALQTKLERSIESVISVNRFKQVSIDDLMRIEKLCEHSLRRTAAEYIMPPTSPGESEIQHWLMRITAFDNGIKSAKTILRIMAGGREEKQVYSEDLLDRALLLIKNNIEGAFIPMIEMRSTGEQQTIFKAAFAQKKPLGGLLHEVTNVLSLFSQMFSSEEATESAINSALYMAASIVFVENASNEKDSLMGIQRVEMFRMAAMDILAKIFARYPDQRSNIIFEQILTNLEKLPVNRATARQFKLVEGGKNIQLVSALIMRLVQTSGTYQAKKKRHRLTADEVNGKLVDGNAVSKHGDSKERIRGEKITKLHQLCVPLMDDAQKTSASIVNYLVQKAMNTTKTGDQPYRHLLDIFTEDFLAVLDSPEWPAAELLLRNLARNMCSIIDGEKQPVTAKTMALDMLGVMGSGICDLVVHLRENHHIREGGGDSLIYQLTNKYLEIDSSGGSRTAALAELEEDLLDWEGPFRISLEHLFEARPHDSALQSACGYHLTVWSSRVCSFREKIGEDDEVVASELKRCATNLRRMVLHKEWDNDLDLGIFSPSQIRLAYTLTVLNMPFCNYFEHLFNRLLRCMDDNQAQSRSKALKSVTQLLGKDPTILNRTQVIPYIIKKAQDASPLVRDSAVDLLGKCIAIRPDIESMVCKTIIERSVDTGVVVRKRSMKILKEIYMHTKRENLKVMIAEALVLRIKDNDNSVAEQAKKIFEEIWIAPFRSLIGEGGETPVEISPQMKLVSNERVAVIVKVVQKDILLAALLDVIKSLLQQDNKNSNRNFQVCKTMVKSMFDDLLDIQGDSERRGSESTMQTLTVFAKADPKLFIPEQLTLLQPYVENLTSDDLHLFRSVIVIYRYSLCILTNRHTGFLQGMQSSLLRNLTRLPSLELREVVSCLWTISGILNSKERLIRVTISCLSNIRKAEGSPITSGVEIKRMARTIYILGLFGHFCDFEDQLNLFKGSFPTWSGNSVAGFITDTIVPFCSSDIESSVRKAAIESLGHVCQSYAVHFIKPRVLEIFDRVFEEKDIDLIKLVLGGFKGFLLLEESRSERERENENTHKKGEKVEEPGRLTQAAYANLNDGVSTSLSQKYLKNIISIAIQSQDGYALIATEVIASILRQGLVHPKEAVPALVALESSTVSAISQIAYREHKVVHSKHETIVERGYLDGIRACFIYQRNVIGDGAGATLNPFTAKLRPLYDVVKEGTRKVKKKLLDTIVSSVDFDPVKLNVEEPPTHLEYTRFIIGNLIFLDYATTDELFQMITTMEKLVAGTGVMVAHSIETEIFKNQNEHENVDKIVNADRLKVLASGAAILMMLWMARTYLRKAYGVNDQKVREYRAGKLKLNDPVMNKVPGRNPNVNMAAIWEQIEETAKGLENSTDMMEQCRQLVELLNVDNELKLVADGGQDNDLEFGSGDIGNTPDVSADEASLPQTPKRKRKSGAGLEKSTSKRRKPQSSKKRRKD